MWTSFGTEQASTKLYHGGFTETKPNIAIQLLFAEDEVNIGENVHKSR